MMLVCDNQYVGVCSNANINDMNHKYCSTNSGISQETELEKNTLYSSENNLHSGSTSLTKCANLLPNPLPEPAEVPHHDHHNYPLSIVHYSLLIVLCLLFSVNAFAEYSGGTGNECDPFIIRSATDLRNMASNVNGGTNYSGKYFLMTEDIDITGETFLIGSYSSKPFCGIFDGGNKTITINITGSSQYTALFPYINNAAIKNLTVSGTVTNNSAFTAAIVGSAYNSHIYNCTNNASVNGTTSFSGVVCFCNSSTRVEKCVNNGAIGVTNTDNMRRGGVVFICSNSFVIECTNNGAIKGKEGIGGVVVFAESNSIIDKCVNTATITGHVVPTSDANGISFNNGFGGIASSCKKSTIRNCYNKGNIIFNASPGDNDSLFMGGIVGKCYKDYTSDAIIENCYNIGDVKSNNNKGRCIGGVAGRLYGVMSNCYNGGTISNATSGEVGAVVGKLANNPAVTKHCYARYNCGTNTGIPLWGGTPSANPYKPSVFYHNDYNNNKITTAVKVNNTDYSSSSNLYVVLNAWVDSVNNGGSSYYRWEEATSPSDNSGMPKFFYCRPITIASGDFSVTTSSGQNALEWTASPSGVASSYTIYWGTPTIYWSCSSNIISPVSANSYAHTGLTAGTTYCYEVMAVGSGDYCAENAHSTRICRTVPTCIPPAVENFAVTQPDAKGRKLQVSWTPETNITYKLYYGVNNPALGLGGLYEVPGTVTPAYTVERLTNGHSYYFVLKPIGGNYCDGTVVYPSTVTPQCNE